MASATAADAIDTLEGQLDARYSCRAHKRARRCWKP
jgi:hypothetical protein